MGLSAGKACTLHNGVNITPALQGKLIDRYEVNNYESFATWVPVIWGSRLGCSGVGILYCLKQGIVYLILDYYIPHTVNNKHVYTMSVSWLCASIHTLLQK